MATSDTITIEGKEYELDDFELGELEWLEDHLGKPIADFAVLNSMKAAVGLIYLVRRREDPSFTLEQARKMKITSIFQVQDPDAPAASAKKRPPKPAAR